MRTVPDVSHVRADFRWHLTTKCHTEPVPASVKLPAATIGLIAVFLIPLVQSSTAQTHALTCRRVIASAELRTNAVGTVTIRDARPLDASGDKGTASGVRFESRSVCGGLVPSLEVATTGPRLLRLDLGVANRTVHHWHATVRVRIGDAVVPIELGSLSPGTTRTPSLRIDLDPGVTKLKVEFAAGP